jgi:ferredoxin
MRQKEKNEREFPQSVLTAHKNMIGEGTKSANQRRHNYVQENVEVGFFTDPTVCIGCKACEVACKEWNHVPDDGFTWSGNSYDNTGPPWRFDVAPCHVS